MIWMKWHDNPVTIKITEKEVPISAIPFPTVIICPVTKNYKQKLNITSVYYALKDNLRNLTDIEYETHNFFFK